MSFSEKNDIPFFSFFKKSAAFFFSSAFLRQSRFPAAIMAVLSLLSFFILKQTVGPDGAKTFSVNPYVLTVILAVFFCLCIATMVQTHFTVTGRTDDRKHLWGLTFGKIELKYAGVLFLTAFCAFVMAALCVVLLVATVMYFMNYRIPDGFAASIVLVLIPYFMLRVVCLFPATVFGDKLTLRGAWKMTRGIAASLSLMYAASATFPLFVTSFSSLFVALIQGVEGLAIVAGFLYAWLAFVMLWMSGIAQASFMGDFYLWLTENGLTDGFSDSFVFSVAKKKERD